MGYFRNIKDSFKLKHYINYIAVALFLVLMVVLNGAGLLSRSFVNLLPRIAYSIILAISLNLVVGFLGELSLGHAGFMCVGAYLGTYFSLLLHQYIGNTMLCFILSMVVGGLTAAIFGFIIGLPALRLKGDYLAIVTLAFGEIVRNIFKNLEVFGGALGLKTSDVRIAPKTMFIVAFIVVLIVLALIQNLIRSKHGRAITAIRDNEIAAKAMGINVTFYKLLVFILSAFFAGVAGVIYGHYVTPISYATFSYNYSIEILVMVVIGGMGSMNGSILAATLITYVNFLLQNNLSGDLAAVRLLVYALVLILVVVFGNAPALAAVREKMNLRNLFKSLKGNKRPEDISDDEAEWNRIPTKVTMDELLSVDIPGDEYTPDAPDKKGGK